MWSTVSRAHRLQQLWRVSSAVAVLRLWSTGSIVVAWAYLFCSKWEPPGPGSKAVSHMGRGFFTIEPPGRPGCLFNLLV